MQIEADEKSKNEVNLLDFGTDENFMEQKK